MYVQAVTACTLHRLLLNFALLSHDGATLAFDLANVRNETVDLCSLDMVKLFPSRKRLVLFQSLLITVLIAAGIHFFRVYTLAMLSTRRPRSEKIEETSVLFLNPDLPHNSYRGPNPADQLSCKAYLETVQCPRRRRGPGPKWSQHKSRDRWKTCILLCSHKHQNIELSLTSPLHILIYP